VAGPLISAEELAPRLARASVLDVRWSLGGPPGREEYAKGHIPGAVFVDLDTELAGPAGDRGRHPLPATADFEQAMRKAGVDDDRRVVVYDADTSLAAARAWWLLRYFGHRDVVVLDGGLAAWTAAGYPVSTETPATKSGGFQARPGALPVLDPEQAATLAGRGLLIDARAGERFRGEVEPIDPVAGHIPGARNLPAGEALDEDGRFRDPDVLRKLFHRVGVRDGVEIGTYCGSGVTAAHAVLALELAGYSAALYPGSWSEWCADRRRPVARGE
jgi:thiosulfate/3-mercaptopyruvate sulfurtransferase